MFSELAVLYCVGSIKSGPSFNMDLTKEKVCACYIIVAVGVSN